MDQVGAKVSEARVAAFEQRLGLALPSEYRQFLLDVNGGRPADTNAEFSAGVVNMLFCLEHEDDAFDLEVNANRAVANLPSKDLLIVGYDEGDASLLLALAGSHRGEVWLQVPDERPSGSNQRTEWHDRRDMKTLADNFAVFMASLKPLT